MFTPTIGRSAGPICYLRHGARLCVSTKVASSKLICKEKVTFIIEHCSVEDKTVQTFEKCWNQGEFGAIHWNGTSCLGSVCVCAHSTTVSEGMRTSQVGGGGLGDQRCTRCLFSLPQLSGVRLKSRHWESKHERIVKQLNRYFDNCKAYKLTFVLMGAIRIQLIKQNRGVRTGSR